MIEIIRLFIYLLFCSLSFFCGYYFAKPQTAQVEEKFLAVSIAKASEDSVKIASLQQKIEKANDQLKKYKSNGNESSFCPPGAGSVSVDVATELRNVFKKTSEAGLVESYKRVLP